MSTTPAANGKVTCTKRYGEFRPTLAVFPQPVTDVALHVNPDGLHYFFARPLETLSNSLAVRSHQSVVSVNTWNCVRCHLRLDARLVHRGSLAIRFVSNCDDDFAIDL